MVFIHAPVGKHQDIGAILVDFVHLHEQTVDGPLQVGALVIGDGNTAALKPSTFISLIFNISVLVRMGLLIFIT